MSGFDRTTRLMSAADLTPLLDTFALQLQWSSNARFQVELALEELIVNTFDYGYKGTHLPGDKAFVDMTVQQNGPELVITLEDNAIAFDPTQFSPPDVTSSAEDRQVGGLGLFLASKMMDNIHYRRENDRNHVLLSKRMD
jgi:anti-sigma regulatory factor (Ser/Thr protein kinase)